VTPILPQSPATGMKTSGTFEAEGDPAKVANVHV
jgi:hypothetical protein